MTMVRETPDDDGSGYVPVWARPPCVAEAPPPRRTLHLCRSASEACLSAVRQEDPGFAVAVREVDGLLDVQWGEATLFGPVVRRRAAPDRDTIFGLVLDTLETGTKDVHLSCIDDAMRDEIADRAVGLGHAVIRAPDCGVSSIREPFSLFSTRRVRPRAGTGGGVMSFCCVDPAEHGPMAVGDVLRMASEEGADGTDIGYVDAGGYLVGLHGRLPFPLDDDARERLSEVEARVAYLSWGRNWRAGRLVDVQFLMFDIPADVDALLADAKMPGGGGGAHP